MTLASDNPRARILATGGRGLGATELVAALLAQDSPAAAMAAARRLGKRLGAGPSRRTESFEAALFHALEDADGVLDLGPPLGAPRRPSRKARDTALRPTRAGLPLLDAGALARLAAAFELARRYAAFREELVAMHAGPPCAADEVAAAALAQISPKHRAAAKEWLGFVPVSRHGAVGALVVVGHGHRYGVSCDRQTLAARILATRPSAILLAHNHPSGALRASAADRSLTREIESLALSLGLDWLGHWIVAGHRSRQVP